MATRETTLTNSYHNTTAKVKLRADGTISRRTYQSKAAALCCTPDCKCGGIHRDNTLSPTGSDLGKCDWYVMPTPGPAGWKRQSVKAAGSAASWSICTALPFGIVMSWGVIQLIFVVAVRSLLSVPMIMLYFVFGMILLMDIAF